MIKKFFPVVVSFFIILGAGISCKSPFEPSTDIGQSVVSSNDTTFKDLSKGFRTFRVDVPVVGDSSIRSVEDLSYTAVIDSVTYHVMAGYNLGQFAVGNTGNEKSIAYTEFRLISIKRAYPDLDSNSIIDSVYLLFYCDTAATAIAARTDSMVVYGSKAKTLGSVADTAALQLKTLGSFQVQCFDPDTGVKVLLDSTYRAMVKKAVSDTSDSTQKIAFCAAAADTGNVMRFRPPYLVIRYKKLVTDTGASILSAPLASKYYDFSVFETNGTQPEASYRSCMETGRITEMRLDLTSLWDSAANYNYVQDVSCVLNTDTSIVEPGSDSMTVLYGLTTQQRVGRGAYLGFRDSLNGLGGKLKVIKVGRAPQTITVPLTMFTQTMVPMDRSQKQNAYLYLYSLGPKWGSITWKPGPNVSLTALFSNPQK